MRILDEAVLAELEAVARRLRALALELENEPYDPREVPAPQALRAEAATLDQITRGEA